MPNNTDDVPLLQHPIPLGVEGAQALVKYWEDASFEVRSLIAKECDIIYECRECRNLFRSIVNFISHKRVTCRSLLDIPGPSSSELQQIVEKVTAEVGPSASNRSNPELNEIPIKKKAYLRRTNIVNAVSKRAEHYLKKLPNSKEKVFLHKLPNVWRSVPTTTFSKGQQLLMTAPKGLAQKETSSSDEVALVVPQDHSIRYREMNLRRRENDPKVAPARYADYDERLLADRLANYPELADSGLLICMHSDCTEKQPFSSLYTLAYHITVRHNRRCLPDNKNFCLICGGFFDNYVLVVDHLKKQHNKYYQEHRLHRMSPNDEKADLKKNRKRKGSEKYASSEQSGSLSPVSDYSDDCDPGYSLCRFDYDFQNRHALDANESDP